LVTVKDLDLAGYVSSQVTTRTQKMLVEEALAKSPEKKREIKKAKKTAGSTEEEKKPSSVT